jgi:hemoglobin
MKHMERQLLDSRENIELLVNQFYTRVKADDLLGPVFNNTENFSWETHIPIMIDFWESLLLGTMKYKGNVMVKHIELHRRTPLRKEQFDQWKKLFYATLDEFFEGVNVAEARRRVEAMAPLMLYKLQQSEQKGFIQ